MKKNIMKKLIFTFMCMSLFTSTVFGVIGTGESGPVNPGLNAPAGSSMVANPNSAGIRISFLKADGTQLYSRDFLTPGNVFANANTQYGNGTPCSKVKYSSGQCTYNNTWQVTSGFSTTADLEAIFLNNGFSTNITNNVNNFYMGKNNLFASVLSSTNKQKVKQFIKQLGVDPDQYLVNGTYDLFLEWEPLTRVTYNNVVFIGTTYEISTMVSGETSEEGFCFENGCASDGYGAVGKIVALKSGCSVFLEGSSTFGNAVAQKLQGFSGSSYFGGKITIYPEIHSYCNYENDNDPNTTYNWAKSSVKPHSLSANSSFGMGLLWIDDMINGFDCAVIDNHYPNLNIPNEINTNGSFNFYSFNTWAQNNNVENLPEGGITHTWYIQNCMPTPPPPGDGGVNCTPEFEVPNCTTGGTLSYVDSAPGLGTSDAYWERCVFTDTYDNKTNVYDINTHKTSSSSLPYKDTTLSNDYCEVYCIENVQATFDSNKPTVLAGANFIWGWSTTNSSRTCRTKEIDWEKFTQDLATANQGVANALAQNQLYNDYSASNWDEGDDVYTGLTGSYECSTVYNHNSGSHTSNTCNGEWTSCNKTRDHCDGARPVETCDYTFTCSGTYSCTNYNYSDSASVTVAGITGTASIDKTDCSANFSSYNPINGGDVSGAIDKVNAVLNKLKSCYNFADASVLNDEAKAYISYIGGVYNYGPAEMSTSVTTTHEKNACTTTDSVTALVTCSGTTCIETSATIPNCESHQETRTSTKIFGLADGVFRYVIKGYNTLTLKSIHEAGLDEYTNGSVDVNYIDNGFSNFPVPYDIQPGTYEGSLKITYSNLGHSVGGSSAVDTILRSTNPNYGDWSCPYTVDTKLVCIDCDPGDPDIDLIYREIDLSNPFPDIDASKRNTGSNWCDLEDCSWNNATSNKYILNNRNRTGDSVYDLEPMYTFIMTPSDVIQIRRYNDNADNSYTSYTGSLDGETYDFKCITGTGKGCRSGYLTKLIDMLDANNNPGTCTSDRGVPSSVAVFEACRYPSNE